MSELSPGARQRRAAVSAGAALTGAAGLSALLAGGGPGALVWTAIGVFLVLVRPHGNPPAFGFLAVVLAWTFTVPRASSWAVLAAVLLVAAHAALAAGGATRDAVPLPTASVVGLIRRCLPVFVVACVAGLTTSGQRVSSFGVHVGLGAAAFVVVAAWVGWLRRRPQVREQHLP